MAKPHGNEIHVFSGAAETAPRQHASEPFPDLPTSFLLAAPTASGKTMIILNILEVLQGPVRENLVLFALHQARSPKTCRFTINLQVLNNTKINITST